jgi:hypothetical protein
MKKLNNDLYILVKGSLQGKTTQEKLEDVNNRIFMNNMVDRWTQEDYEYNDVLYQLKYELEGELNGK